MTPSELESVKEAITGVRKVLSRDNFRSNFDGEASKPTNWGNKLKRRAEFFHEGQIGDQRPYKKRIKHAGHHRYIVHQNPQRYDEEGYELSDNDDDAEADEDVAERNPYSHIAIEKILMPLTAASELQSHPTMSIPYRSKIMSGMVEQACNMVHKERKSLVELKLLLTIFRGDHNWILCGNLYTIDDVSLFHAEMLPAELSDENIKDEPATRRPPIFLAQEKAPTSTRHTARVQEKAIADKGLPCPKVKLDQGVQESDSTLSMNALEVTGATANLEQGTTKQRIGQEKHLEDWSDRQQAGTSTNEAAPVEGAESTVAKPESVQASSLVPDDEADGSSLPSRMLTRGQAQAQASAVSPGSRRRSRSSSPASSQSTLSIHPLYLPPTTATPDRNHQLPETEADDMRRILSALVQKQEEVVRGSEQMYEGLLKAHRLTRTVWSWCKAEGHVGEMSDGEDWVDAEEWGLDSPLKKGQEEVDDTAERRPRGRRTAQ